VKGKNNMSSEYAALLGLVNLLVDKKVVSSKEVEDVRRVSHLLKVLVSKGLISEKEVTGATSLYTSFLERVDRILNNPNRTDRDIEILTKRYGKKYPSVVRFLKALVSGKESK